jgi:hypothetical protein
LRFFKKLLDKKESETLRMDDSEAIFAMTSASLLLEEKLNIKFAHTGSLCIKIIHGSHFRNTIRDCENLLNVSKEEFNFNYKIFKDTFGYLWFIIIGHDLNIKYNSITNIAAAISSLGDIIEENGFTLQILSVIFKFELLKNSDKWFENLVNSEKYLNSSSIKSKKIQQDINMIDLYIIYNYKTNNFYPFIPNLRKNKDMSKEMKILSILKYSVPTEKDFSKWFPIKDIPF